MSNAIENLWPTDLAAHWEDPFRAILLAQAKGLSERTGGKVCGEVSTSPGQCEDIYHTFYLRVPAYNDYRFVLLRVWHPLSKTYPIGIEDTLEILPEKGELVDTEEEFIRLLAEVLRSEKTKNVIGALMSNVA